LLEIGDDVVRQLAAFLLRRHPQVLVRPAQGFEEQAFAGISRDYGMPSVAALADAFPRIEQQSAFDLLRLGGVALVTFLDEHRANALLKKGGLIRLDRRGASKRSRHRGEE
jgi:hypothetical protein